jgi:hypothetical protein
MWRVIHGNQETQFFDTTWMLEQYIITSQSLSLIRLKRLNVKYHPLDSEYSLGSYLICYKSPV